MKTIAIATAYWTATAVWGVWGWISVCAVLVAVVAASGKEA